MLSSSIEYLTNLLEDIIARDLVRVFKIRRDDLLRDIFRIIATFVGSRTSYNRLANVTGVSVDTIREYLGYFESAFLMKSLEKWAPSFTERIYAAKKIYLMDIGFKTLITGSGDLGAKADNAVFAHILKEGYTFGYF